MVARMWITNGEIADVAVILGSNRRKHSWLFWWKKVHLVLRPSTSLASIPTGPSVTSGLMLDEVRVPTENLLPGTEGLKSALLCLNEARFGIAWGRGGGRAMACYEGRP